MGLASRAAGRSCECSEMGLGSFGIPGVRGVPD